MVKYKKTVLLGVLYVRGGSPAIIDIEKNPEARALRTEVSPALKPGGFFVS